MSPHATDRLYDLLPAHYRRRDAEAGGPLRALLGVIAEQVAVVEADIERLYDNAFIETCDDWVVPYIGELLGVHGSAGGAGRGRRDVGNALRHRRRKGSASVLEEMATEVAGWPCRAVEFDRQIVATRSVAVSHAAGGGTVDVRDARGAGQVGSPFDGAAHGVDVRRPQSQRGAGRHNLPSVGVFVWRLRVFPVTQAPAGCVDRSETARYTFSVLGNDAPLFRRPSTDAGPHGETPDPFDRLPAPLTRARLADAAGRVAERHYGEGRSLALWRCEGASRTLVDRESLFVADLSDWRLRPAAGTVAIDPVLGRIAFAPDDAPPGGLAVSYCQGAGDAMGGGEYRRPSAPPRPGCVRYLVGRGGDHDSLADALEAWKRQKPAEAVIEVASNEVQADLPPIELAKDQRLEIRAGAATRPLIVLRDRKRDGREFLQVRGAAGSRLTLAGLLVAGRGLQLRGRLALLTLGHCTFVPGWDPLEDFGAGIDLVASLRLENVATRVVVESCVIGSIAVVGTVPEVEPPELVIRDSIVDATGVQRRAIDSPDREAARVRLTVERSTVIGRVHATELLAASDSVFVGDLRVVRRQAGCLRYCHVPIGSRTPPRHACQPDLAIEAEPHAPPAQVAARVEPRFSSLRYGTPDHARLADDAPREIARGAEDGGEMGAFHRLHEPQRLDLLRESLEAFVPADSDVGVFLAE